MRGGTRTSGSEGGGEETDGHKAVNGASPPTLHMLMPSRVTVSVSAIPSRNEAAAPGCDRSSSDANRRSCSSARA